MRHISKWIWLTVVAVATLAAVSATAVSARTTAARPTQAAAPAAAHAKFKVGLITDIGGINDRGFNQFAYQGLKRAQAQLGIQGRVLESHSNADYLPNLTQLAREKYDLIITVGFLTGDATHKVAKLFPKIHFAIVDFGYAPADELPNLESLLFKEQQAGYLVGYLAGLVTSSGIDRTNKDKVVSSVGGQKIPPVDRYIAGFQKGAHDANPAVKTLNSYSQDFLDQAKCKELALNQIAAGSDVVFNVAGGCGLGALDAAKEKHVWGIGVDSDQSFLGAHILTSARKKVDVAVYSAIKAALGGKFQKGTRSFELLNAGVGFGKVAPSVPAKFVAKVKAQEKLILSGKIKIPTTVK
ncbi:MAG: BMP family lipoprotein [Gaiellaceae bacterium]